MRNRHRVIGALAAFPLLMLLVLAMIFFTGCRTTTSESSGLLPSASSEASAPADLAPTTASAPRLAVGGKTVYITDSGKKYHVVDCSSLSKSRTPLNLAEAKRQGYTPCKRCKPPR